ncbi:MAG: hypothetical protein WED33_02380 [Bacteroidia bacterium]
MKHYTYSVIICLIARFTLNVKANNLYSEKNFHTYNISTQVKTIHVFVALCDNKYQGIVPVPANIGNGQDAKNNLYWGCAFGISTYFKRSTEWQLIESQKAAAPILERLIFKHKTENCYLVADAYDGQFIEQCTLDFLNSSCGKKLGTVTSGNTSLGINGNANLLAYIGHDGLMDFQLNDDFVNIDNKRRDVMVLACYSKHFFSKELKSANVNPLLWTSGLMCPEAYTIHDAIRAYIKNQNASEIRKSAALAYSKYQKCSNKAATNLLLSGW